MYRENGRRPTKMKPFYLFGKKIFDYYESGTERKEAQIYATSLSLRLGNGTRAIDR